MDKFEFGSGEPCRPGEIASPGVLPGDAMLTFIGRIETPWSERTACPRQGERAGGPLCRLIVDDRWALALDGIETHAELQVLYWMDEARRDLVRLAPKGGGHAGTVRIAGAHAAQPDRVVDRHARRA